ncbi:hypothetical protein [Lichenibacterium dinghuense]|uniref:hypothetical protein n=1 Tax=Lichenibacterium dinghuense TaxID=2895977 RepID=UPI001F17BCBF|nr:hypothetical protein [Lichenibacterium sp. 6Y81]
MTDRRSFLTGLVSLPLIGRPAAAVPLIQAAALPTLDDPRQRARYVWEAFSAAMRDLTADAHGWRIRGAGEAHAFRTLAPVSFLNVASIHYEVGLPGLRPADLIVERHRDLDLGDVGGAMIAGRRG